ncbi:hypothetical protein [Paraburkholderia terrae]|uniref:XapX domain-containing protein n=1 Tax=Paraburkholderia terrae TaxID=311230 RepID=A0ABN6JW59_9BURK|nr:hypothetical protein [Paraburkholderia terrae]BCZ84389.1 hypothetical protein PTKU64_80640 [Paraburkholderia terrae]BDC45646.1 hypothetical protein PTKU15_89430 [Paraburkholderia terrae]
MMKKNFESGLILGGGLGASIVMFALPSCEGFKLTLGLGALAIAASVVVIAVERPVGKQTR